MEALSTASLRCGALEPGDFSSEPSTIAEIAEKNIKKTLD